MGRHKNMGKHEWTQKRVVSERNRVPREHVFWAHIHTKRKKRLANLSSGMEVRAAVACKGGSDWRGRWADSRGDQNVLNLDRCVCAKICTIKASALHTMQIFTSTFWEKGMWIADMTYSEWVYILFPKFISCFPLKLRPIINHSPASSCWATKSCLTLLLPRGL